MASDYIIAIGGTGARCLEATIFLAAAGLFKQPLHILMIDPDQNNGNSVRTGSLVPLYHRLSRLSQPREARQRMIFSSKKLQPQILFRASVNFNGQVPSEPYPYFWQDPNDPDRTFSKAIGYATLSEPFQDFVRLFYEDEDISMKLGKGYRGRPNIGAVTLISDLKRTTKSPGKGLFELINAIRADLKSDAEAVRVFVFGSVFGGTGAAGLPTIPELLREEFEQEENYQKLRFGCAMMTPYFTFPKAVATSREGPAPDPNIHQVATQAALLYYAHVPPSYQHAYVIGAPDMLQSKVGHQAGGEGQENDAHYSELVAALSARDFFSLRDVKINDHLLHYADGDHLDWDTLPALPTESVDKMEIKRRLLAFTTCAYLYRNVLHNDLKDARWYSNQAWYKDNFRGRNLTLEDQGQNLETLNEFLGAYLRWLHMIGQSVNKEKDQLFNWDAFSIEGRAAEKELGKLSISESGNQPKHADVSYGKIVEQLNYLTPTYANTPHPVGLLVYLLHEAISDFNKENYRLRLPA